MDATLAPRVKIEGPSDTRILLRIFEQDGTVNVTELWGPSAEHPFNAAYLLEAALWSFPSTNDEDTAERTVSLGEIVIDDAVVINVDGAVIEHERAGELICEFLIAALRRAVAEHESAS